MSLSIVFGPGNSGTVNINTVNIRSSEPAGASSAAEAEAGATTTAIPTPAAAHVATTTTTDAAANVTQTEQPPPNFACFGNHVKHQFLCMITAGSYQYEGRFDPVDRARLIEFLQDPTLKQELKNSRDKKLRQASRKKYELDGMTLLRRKGTATSARERALICPSYEEIFDIVVVEHMKLSHLQRDKVRHAIN